MLTKPTTISKANEKGKQRRGKLCAGKPSVEQHSEGNKLFLTKDNGDCEHFSRS